jgi:thiamine-monophosphate kinase
VEVSEIGEFGLIERLASILGREAPADLTVGIGDDAAVWRAGDQYVIATTDTMVEGVHFEADAASWADIGWKALAVNVSDIGAMGGEPLFALVTLALPPGTAVEDMEALYRGLSECAAEYGVAIAGGDIVSAPQVSVTVALTGRAQVASGEPLLLLRSGAKPGDAIAVSGTLGNAAAGLRRLREGGQLSDRMVRAHMRPSPPLSLGQEAAYGGLRCGIDVSDGLLQDIGHICEMSGLGALVRADSVPTSPGLTSAYPQDALLLACAGGEDYELVLVGDRERIERAGAAVGVAVTFIGEMVEDDERRARLLDAGGNEINPGSPGWDHLRGAAFERRA